MTTEYPLKTMIDAAVRGDKTLINGMMKELGQIGKSSVEDFILANAIARRIIMRDTIIKISSLKYPHSGITITNEAFTGGELRFFAKYGWTLAGDAKITVLTYIGDNVAIPTGSDFEDSDLAQDLRSATLALLRSFVDYMIPTISGCHRQEPTYFRPAYTPSKWHLDLFTSTFAGFRFEPEGKDKIKVSCCDHRVEPAAQDMIKTG